VVGAGIAFSLRQTDLENRITLWQSLSPLSVPLHFSQAVKRKFILSAGVATLNVTIYFMGSM
jgi:hypothetical protein